MLKLTEIWPLTHWGRVTHICVGKLTIIGSDNGLSPGRRQAIIWTNAGIELIGPLGTNFNEISIGIQKFAFKKMHLKVSSAKWRPCCLGLKVLTIVIYHPVALYLPRSMATEIKQPASRVIAFRPGHTHQVLRGQAEFVTQDSKIQTSFIPLKYSYSYLHHFNGHVAKLVFE